VTRASRFGIVHGDGGTDRGQLVLAAAGVVAVALLAMTVAYLQLGAHPDVAAEREVGPREAVDRAVGVLSRAVDDARYERTGRAWGERDAVASAVRADLASALESLRTARIASGTAYAVSYDQPVAEAYAREHCPSGDGRTFGDCDAIDGVVVQERAGETTVVAVAFEVVVTTPDGETTVEVVV
jgi:hypothetical protein